jgi:hypothetical protein
MSGYFSVKQISRENVELYGMLSLTILRFDLIIECVFIKKRGSNPKGYITFQIKKHLPMRIDAFYRLFIFHLQRFVRYI